MMSRAVTSLIWILRAEMDRSLERLPCLPRDKARQELGDLMAARELIVDLGGYGETLDSIGVDLELAHIESA